MGGIFSSSTMTNAPVMTNNINGTTAGMNTNSGNGGNSRNSGNRRNNRNNGNNGKNMKNRTPGVGNGQGRNHMNSPGYTGK